MSDEFFNRRPQRQEQCSRCQGHGMVDRPYVLAPMEYRVTGAPGSSISAMVVGSASIFEATREASDIARQAGRTVAFDFNGIVVVGVDDDPEAVARAWWQATYNETPEQSAARR